MCGLDETEVLEISKQILRGLDFMHQCNVVNLDLSLENILCSGFGTANFLAVLTDFGQSRLLPPPTPASFGPGLVSRSAFMRNSSGVIVCGKEFYAPPEYSNPNSFGRQSTINAVLIDVWAAVIFLIRIYDILPLLLLRFIISQGICFLMMSTGSPPYGNPSKLLNRHKLYSLVQGGQGGTLLDNFMVRDPNPPNPSTPE
jgi:serine/threonine protein kinase